MQGPIASYVSGVGEKIATAAGVPGLCTFTVVNTDVVNAFAVPGCYIYITRRLMALMNSEDELASVLGHEGGHVTADHSAQRQNTATLSTIGAILAGVATDSGDVFQAASQLAQIYTLSYSRDQEFQSDDLGVRYMRAAGYDPFAAGDMLAQLGRADALAARTQNRETSRQIPTWARTHPLSQDRVVRATQQAQAATGGVRGDPPERVSDYFAAINGLLYADDPEQGFVNGRSFAHPGLRIAFDAPDGFVLQNSPQAVVIAGASGRAQFSGGGALNGGLDAYASAVLRQVIGRTPAQLGAVTRGNSNGLETAFAPARAQTQSGQLVDVAVAAYRISDRGFHFITMTPADGGRVMTPLYQSMRLLSDAQIAQLRPRRIDIVTVGARDTIDSLARRIAYPDFQTERFLTLNGMDASTPLRVGQPVKIITYAR